MLINSIQTSDYIPLGFSMIEFIRYSNVSQKFLEKPTYFRQLHIYNLKRNSTKLYLLFKNFQYICVYNQFYIYIYLHCPAKPSIQLITQINSRLLRTILVPHCRRSVTFLGHLQALPQVFYWFIYQRNIHTLLATPRKILQLNLNRFIYLKISHERKFSYVKHSARPFNTLN